MSASRTIAELISALPEEERIILTLHYLKAMSSSEIAEILHVPERSVTALIDAGKRRITAQLGL
ncbi:MAG: sigma-70 family RNA polymerase sigma factor [Actinobacteria bacterium]|jgi:RNA polymerase sigma factor (sigma-70 family)|nr:sigma-70 family RNA polymerase sigma factor [Actinomycetota bacterium]